MPLLNNPITLITPFYSHAETLTKGEELVFGLEQDEYLFEKVFVYDVVFDVVRVVLHAK